MNNAYLQACGLYEYWGEGRKNTVFVIPKPMARRLLPHKVEHRGRDAQSTAGPACRFCPLAPRLCPTEKGGRCKSSACDF